MEGDPSNSVVQDKAGHRQKLAETVGINAMSVVLLEVESCSYQHVERLLVVFIAATNQGKTTTRHTCD